MLCAQFDAAANRLLLLFAAHPRRLCSRSAYRSEPKRFGRPFAWYTVGTLFAAQAIQGYPQWVFHITITVAVASN